MSYSKQVIECWRREAGKEVNLAPKRAEDDHCLRTANTQGSNNNNYSNNCYYCALGPEIDQFIHRGWLQSSATGDPAEEDAAPANTGRRRSSTLCLRTWDAEQLGTMGKEAENSTTQQQTWSVHLVKCLPVQALSNLHSPRFITMCRTHGLNTWSLHRMQSTALYFEAIRRDEVHS